MAHWAAGVLLRPIGHTRLLPRLLVFLMLLPRLAVAHQYYLEAAPTNVVTKGQGLYTELQTASTEEGFLSYLFGTDCYSQTVANLNKNCKSLTADERARLAYSMSRCFLDRATGEKPPAACPEAKHISECTKGLTDKAFNVYTQFYTNIYSICLFVANQNFIKQAESLTSAMWSASMVAFTHLQHLGGNLSLQQHALERLSTGMTDIQQGQQQLAFGVQQGIQGIHQLSSQAQHVQLALNTSISLQHALAQGTQDVARDVAQLAVLEAGRATEAMEKWEAAEAAAAALLSRQARYEELQTGLASASDALARRTAGLQSTLDNVLTYQRKTEAVMSYMLGRSCKWSDVVFYSVSALCILVFSPLLPGYGPGIIGGTKGVGLLALVCCLTIERHVVAWLSHLTVLTPDGQVVVALPLPTLLNLIVSGPVIHVDPRWACRVSTAAAAMYLMIVWRSRSATARSSRAQHTTRDSEMSEVLATLEHHMQVLAHQQQVILRHVCPEHVSTPLQPRLLAFRDQEEPGPVSRQPSKPGGGSARGTTKHKNHAATDEAQMVGSGSSRRQRPPPAEPTATHHALLPLLQPVTAALGATLGYHDHAPNTPQVGPAARGIQKPSEQVEDMDVDVQALPASAAATTRKRTRAKSSPDDEPGPQVMRKAKAGRRR